MLELPLFPLPETVVFPGMTVPLYVFEARYRRLVRHCLDNEPHRFVIALTRSESDIRDTEPAVHAIGTFVDIISVSENPDGSFNLRAHGQGRCQVVVSRDEVVAEPDGGRSRLFFTPATEVPLLREDPNLERLAGWDALEAFRAYAATFFADGALEQVEKALPSDLLYQASFICANLRIPAASRQVLLEAPSLSARFQLASKLIAERIHAHQQDAAC